MPHGVLVLCLLAAFSSVARAQGSTGFADTLYKYYQEPRSGQNVVCWGGGSNVPEEVFADQESNNSFYALEVGGAPNDTFVCGLAFDEEGSYSYRMMCWGDNKRGQLGTESFRASDTPVPVLGVSEVVTGAFSQSHVCVIDVNSTAWCWGDGSNGELGNGLKGVSNMPVRVAGGLSFASVAAGLNFTCGMEAYSSVVTELDRLYATGPVWCFGQGNYGQLGTGSKADSSEPVKVAGGRFFRRIDTGAKFACGLVAADGALFCWGYGPGFNSVEPVEVVPAGVFIAITAGAYHICGLTGQGKAMCWGNGQDGQLGNGKTLYSSKPVEVAGDHTWFALSAGVNYTCGIDIYSTAWCWGLGTQGQLGTPSRTQNSSAVPRAMADYWTFADISAGNGRTCAIAGKLDMLDAFAPAPAPVGRLVEEPTFPTGAPEDTTVVVPPAPAPTQAPPAASMSSSFPVAAVAGGVCTAVALLALLAFLVLRRGKVWLRRRQPVDQLVDTRSSKPLKDDTLLPKPSPPAGKVGGSITNSVQDTSTASRVDGYDGDPVLTFISGFIKSRLSSAFSGAGSLGTYASGNPSSRGDSTFPSGSTALSGSSRELPMEVQHWEVAWDHIQLSHSIGRGSFGKVYLGAWRSVHVAVKVLINQDLLTEEGMELSRSTLGALQEEASVMARLRHPNIVNFLGLCTLPPCIIMEYCSRGSLYDLLVAARRQEEMAAQFTWRMRLRLAVDAATGLLYLHSMAPPIIHRDVKSPNILVDENWRGRIADFNLSRLEELQPGPVSSAGGAKNPTWLAPEVLAGQRASTASDVYSFGLVLYELLTFTLPWDASGPAVFQVAYMVLNGKRPDVPLREALPGHDSATFGGLDAYCELMRECWAQAPGDRPTFDAVVPRLYTLLNEAAGS